MFAFNALGSYPSSSSEQCLSLIPVTGDAARFLLTLHDVSCFWIASLCMGSLVAPATVDVVAVDRTEKFAGRNGRLVTEILTVRAEGELRRVIVDGAYHDRYMNPARKPKSGDVLVLNMRKIGANWHADRQSLRIAKRS